MNVKYQGNIVKLQDPNVCPHCHVTINPHHRWNTFTNDTDDVPSYLTVWQCSNSKCSKHFIALYKKLPGGSNFIFNRFLNGLPKGPDWPQPILELNDGKSLGDDKTPQQTKFIKTYLQSLEAEMHGLDELAGMGYRKAIEYLVKDWAIQNNPQEKDKVEQLWLKAVIEEYYDKDLKDILERATWLGNDQSHYNKLFEEYDIEVLKELIDLIMVELDRQYKKDLYINTIKSRK